MFSVKHLECMSEGVCLATMAEPPSSLLHFFAIILLLVLIDKITFQAMKIIVIHRCCIPCSLTIGCFLYFYFYFFADVELKEGRKGSFLFRVPYPTLCFHVRDVS